MYIPELLSLHSGKMLKTLKQGNKISIYSNYFPRLNLITTHIRACIVIVVLSINYTILDTINNYLDSKMFVLKKLCPGVIQVSVF